MSAGTGGVGHQQDIMSQYERGVPMGFLSPVENEGAGAGGAGVGSGVGVGTGAAGVGNHHAQSPAGMDPTSFFSHTSAVPSASFFSAKLNDMFKQTTPQESLSVEELQERRNFLRNHRLLPTFMEMLTTCKKEGIIPDAPPLENNLPVVTDWGLDEFLESQGIDTSPSNSDDPVKNQQREEFLYKLEQLRFKFKEEVEKLNKVQNECISQMLFILREQSTLRPVGEAEAQSKLQRVKQKFDYVKNQLRVCVCDAIAALQKQYNQVRKKHKSLPKKASQSLTTWFFEHINNPYPTEQEKSMLAAAGNLTLIQVNNWFGNKRIRYKRKCLENESKRLSTEDIGPEDLGPDDFSSPGVSPNASPTPPQPPSQSQSHSLSHSSTSTSTSMSGTSAGSTASTPLATSASSSGLGMGNIPALPHPLSLPLSHSHNSSSHGSMLQHPNPNMHLNMAHLNNMNNMNINMNQLHAMNMSSLNHLGMGMNMGMGMGMSMGLGSSMPAGISPHAMVPTLHHLTSMPMVPPQVISSPVNSLSQHQYQQSQAPSHSMPQHLHQSLAVGSNSSSNSMYSNSNMATAGGRDIAGPGVSPTRKSTRVRKPKINLQDLEDEDEIDEE